MVRLTGKCTKPVCNCGGSRGAQFDDARGIRNLGSIAKLEAGHRYRKTMGPKMFYRNPFNSCRCALVFGLSLTLSARHIGAPVAQPDTIAAEQTIVAARRLFRHDSAPSTIARQNLVADSLMHLALLSPATRESTTHVRLAGEAVRELGYAGNPQTLGFRGAVPRLLRVALESPNDSVAWLATTLLHAQTDTTAAVAALKRLALERRQAYRALVALSVAYGRTSIAREAIRQLYLSRAESEPLASDYLNELALKYGFHR